ncbi:MULTISPECIES: glycosyltransferase [unclassified Leifsonia]|uniref:glycosyltransferase n=1 Tax=unclassified Leifsonia TaxID=2663824 RepID=UPI0006FAF5D8|nr:MULTISPECIES: glycosyltransferase [unclassified Leifsonia]KQX06375.1 hypothetical protein ASC59_00385 [Leifsonia sp. Root1293]KRA10659.1 hypothetical protein ASD61_00385 [Leifsonia sp. Root60]
MTTLRVIADHLIAGPTDVPDGYSVAIARAIIATTPEGCDVEAIVPGGSDDLVSQVRAELAGLSEVQPTSLSTRGLAVAWSIGAIASSGRGLVHAPGLRAPLRSHDRARGDQISVTVHDTLAWTSPSTIGRDAVAVRKAFLRRARRFADAIVVPSHAVADQLAEIADFGDRIRVIAGAGSIGLALPPDADRRAVALDLPTRFILAEGSLDAGDGITDLITGLRRSDPGLPLLVHGADASIPDGAEHDELRADVAAGRVRLLGELAPEDRAVVLDRAAVFVFPGIEAGFGAPIIDALRFGLPVVHSDAPALVELVGEAGISVQRDDADSYPERLSSAVTTILSDDDRAGVLRIVGSDRAKAFTWGDAGERIWQLHADL